MHLLLGIIFGYLLVRSIVSLLFLAAAEWPRHREPQTLGEAVAQTIIGLAIAFWAALLLWWK